MFSFLISIFLVFLALPGTEPAPVFFDHSEWDQFLKQYVNEKGEVNYEAAKKNPEHLLNYMQKIRAIPEDHLNVWPREERMAIFINIYNAGVIKAVLDHYPLKTLMRVSSVWDEAKVEIATPPKKDKAQGYSLNQIRKGLLVEQFRDEKILFALSSGAKDSPPLSREALVGAKLEGQLYLVTKKFVNDESQNVIDPAEKKVKVSRIFQWYAQDFLFNWGDFPEDVRWNPEQRAVLSFFAHYLEDHKKAEFLREERYKVKYSTFDWQLNDWKPEAGTKSKA